ncbi:Hypothetical predicted protein [Mytilus galloprovincialis]|uniref:Endonuclease/exonuclease/phosphatase domain-containing protein n=1 Tax=Mytilus galloprovincialis TaxID=29158 RepID=A0A8B6FKI9_MYTGA|nr:Hypothetical predicted protein [Mytilus galloprovincialis]
MQVFKSEIHLDLARESSRIDDLANSVHSLSVRFNDIEESMNNLNTQTESINPTINDRNSNTQVNPMSNDVVTVIMKHLQFAENENLVEIMNDIIHKLGQSVAKERNKHKLKTDENYKTVFIQCAKSRIERLRENNTRVILRELSQGNHVCETHLIAGDNLRINGYIWKGFNRKLIHRDAPKGSGGVGLLITQWILNDYNFEVVDASFEGLFCVKFTSKSTDFSFTVFSCYSPPEGSIRGRNSQNFFSHLLLNIYDQSESDVIVICVDFNSRIGTLNYFSDFDSIRSRTLIDKTVNQHGKSLLEFLNESKTCVLNGIYDSNKDNFTCLSGRGKSVVDYMCVPHDILELCSSFQVITTRSVIEQNNLFQFLGERSKIPDHSILLAEFKTLTNISEYSSSKIDKSKRFRLKSVPNDFLGFGLQKAAIQTLIQRIETTRETQSHVNNIYSDLCTLIGDEMNSKIPIYDASRKTRKRHKSSKPFWNEELGQLWNAMRLKEKQFLSFKGRSSTRRRFREEFQHAQKSFDRKLRQCERHYRQSFCLKIDNMVTSNPNDFWDKIKKLGPRKVQNIPMEIYGPNGEILTDDDSLLNRRKTDFHNIYNIESSSFPPISYKAIRIQVFKIGGNSWSTSTNIWVLCSMNLKTIK